MLFAAVWVLRRRETAYLLFFALSALAYIRCLHYYVGRDPLLIPEKPRLARLTVDGAGWLALVTYFLAFPVTRPALSATRTMVDGHPGGRIASDPTGRRPHPGMWEQIFPPAYLLIFATVIVLSVAMCLASWRRRSVRACSSPAAGTCSTSRSSRTTGCCENYLLDIEGIYLMPYRGARHPSSSLAIILRRCPRALANMESAQRQAQARLGAERARPSLSATALVATHRRTRAGLERRASTA